MNRVKKGSILLEAICAMAIVLIIITMSYKMCITMENIGNKEMEIYKDKEALNALCNEVKYNIPYSELKKVLKEKTLLIRYDNEFLNKLVENKLLEYESAYIKKDYISIEILSDKNETLKIRIEIKDDNRVYTEEIEKGQWMDYV